MPNNNIANALQEIASQLVQFRSEMEARFSNVTDDIKNLDEKVDKLREGQAIQAGGIEANHQQIGTNKKKLGGSQTPLLVNGIQSGIYLKTE